MLRAVFASLGLGSNTSTVSTHRMHSPFSKTAAQKANLPTVLLSRPLTISTNYPAGTVKQSTPKRHGLFDKSVKSALKKNSLFGENNPDTIKKWLGNYLKNINLRMKFARMEKFQFNENDQFVGFNTDKLMNGNVVVYPLIIPDNKVRNNLFNLAKKKKKTLGVLELTKNITCWRVMFPNNFWIALIPHTQLRVYRKTPESNTPDKHHQHPYKK